MDPSYLPDVWFDKSEEFVDGVHTRDFGITIESNIDPTCFSIRQTYADSEEEDLIHFCDWPRLRAAIDAFMAERKRLAREYGDRPEGDGSIYPLPSPQYGPPAFSVIPPHPPQGWAGRGYPS